jgi:hypothetical protein
MPGFAKTETHGVVLWVGDPDCQAAHDATLRWLRGNCPVFCPTPSATDNILKGNLGETITFCVGYWYVFNGSHVHAFSANALNPFGGISKADIDIVWIHFGETGDDDMAILQEVKTTGEPSLSLADGLINDYDKLFGTDPRFTLHMRLQGIKNAIEYEHKRPDLCPRMAELAGQSPHTSSRVLLCPTLVHERHASDPQTKMLAIRETLCGKGWARKAVQPWAIGFFDLNERLLRLAMGQHE